MASVESIVKKARDMEEKSQFVIAAFNLPATEEVVQDYHAGLLRLAVPIQGRLYITSNFACFHAPLLNVSFALDQIRSLKRYNAFLVMPTGITVTLLDKTEHHFQSFVHREEAFTVLNYLWKHEPFVLDVPDVPPPPTSATQAAADDAFEFDINAPRAVRRAQPLGVMDKIQTKTTGVAAPHVQLQTYAIDTKRTQNILRIIDETEQVGAGTLQKLSEQGEQLERADAGLDRIEAELKHGDRIVKGMTISGAIANKLSAAPTAASASAPQRKATAGDVAASDALDVEVLLKRPDDSLVPAILRIFKERFAFFNPDRRAQLLPDTGYEDSEWQLATVSRCVMRARHLHMDVVLKGGEGDASVAAPAAHDDEDFHVLPHDKRKMRVRVMSSYLQVIANELVRQTRLVTGKACAVEFEPGVKHFDLDSPLISNGPGSWRPLPRGADDAALAAAAGISFQRTTSAGRKLNERALETAPKLVTADEATQRALLEQEAHLHAISDGIGRLKQIGTVMGSELERQNDLLSDMIDKTDDVNAHVKSSTARVNNLL
jgi:hypothetical protein